MNKSTKIIIWIVVLALAIWGLSSLNKKAEVAPTSGEPIKIGAILPLSGPIAKSGEFAKQGIDMALQDINKDGEKVRVFFEDYAYDSKQALSAYNKLHDIQQVDAFYVFGTPAGMPLSPIVNKDKLPLLSLLAGVNYSTPDDYTYRVIGSGKFDAKAAYDVLVDKLGKKRIAVVYLNNDYGAGALAEFKKLIVGRAEVVAEEGAAPGVTDYRTQLTKIKSANPDSIFLPTLYKEGGSIIKQAKEMGLNTTFVCGQPCETPEFINASGLAAEGTIVMAPTVQTSNGFGARYEQLYGMKTNYVTLRSYDAIKVLATVADSCKSENYSGECLKKNIDGLKNFPGLSFPINFDRNGDINDQFSIEIVKDGKFVPYEL